MTDSGMPAWAFENGQLSPDKIIKNLYLYNYVEDTPEGTQIKPELHKDYPKLFELLFAYQANQVAAEYVKKIDDGKVVGYYDNDGNHKYRIEE